MLFATDATATDGHEALFLLGTQYQDILRDLKAGANFEKSNIEGTGVSALSELREALTNNLDDFKRSVSEFETARMQEDRFPNYQRDKFLHPEDPYQSELAELLIGPCSELIEACSRFEQLVESQQKKKID
jgi:hypothetical protein